MTRALSPGAPAGTGTPPAELEPTGAHGFSAGGGGRDAANEFVYCKNAANTHGDPFPLPALLRRPVSRSGTSRPLIRRMRRREAVDELAADAASALNALHGAQAGRPLRCAGAAPTSNQSPLTPPQTSVVARLRRCARKYLPPPPAANTRDGALKELLKCNDFYQVGEESTRVPMDLGKLKVLKGEMVPHDVVPLVGPEARPYVQDPDRFIVRTKAEEAINPRHVPQLPPTNDLLN